MRSFDPWVGSMYCSLGFNGVRLLILGESSYGAAGSANRSGTIDDVRELGQRAPNRFFTKIFKLVSGVNSVSASDRAEFWEHVAFYNFVQSLVGDRSRLRPTAKMWTDATAPFLDTVAELQPHLVVALGFKLRDYLPVLPSSVTVCSIQHPSSFGFTYAPWRASVVAALEVARAAIGHESATNVSP